jgi:thioredoxin reductase
MENKDTHYECVIIGGGPAGLQMAYFLQKFRVNYVVYEKGPTVGSFFQEYPRQRRLISYNKVHCGDVEEGAEYRLRFDWNSLLIEDGFEPFKEFSTDMFPHASAMVSYLGAFAQKYELNVEYNTDVKLVSRENQCFVLSVLGRRVTCNTLYMATGVRPKPVPRYLKHVAESVGAQLSSYDTMSMDLERYKNKHVCIVGSGNAAFEVATHINAVAAGIMLVGPAKVGWRSHYPGFLRSVNMQLVDTFYLKVNNAWYIPPPNDGDQHEVGSHVCLHLHNDLIKWAGRGKVDLILYCGGFQWAPDMFDNESCMPALDTHGYPSMDDTYQSTNVKGLYFIGTLMQGSDYKLGSSTFIHGFRYNIRWLAQHNHGQLTRRSFGDKERVLSHIVHRINNSSCLPLRYEFYCDWLEFTESGFNYVEDVPISYAKVLARSTPRSWILYMGYASEFDWNFRQREFYHPRDASKCVFLHPIIIYHNQGHVEEFHIGESPTLQFSDPDAHILPMRIYLEYAIQKRTDKQNVDYEVSCIQIPPILERHALAEHSC